MAIGKINGVTLQGGGGGGGTPVLISSKGGRIQQATNNYYREMAMGGTIGWTFYNWSGAVSTTNLAGLGTPGSSTLSFNGSVYNGIDSAGAFVPIDGTPVIQGVLLDDGASTVAGSNIWYHVWKMSATYVSGMASGTYNSTDTPTLVASAQTTTPSSIANITPVSFRSTNGVSVSAGDFLVATMATNAVVTATEYRKISYNLFIEP